MPNSQLLANGPIEEVGAHSPAQTEVLSKYQTAAELANKALAFACSLVVPGASVLDICRRTDEELTSAAAKVYSRGKVARGVAFPCCVSLNGVLGYNCPTDGTTDQRIGEGDLVKLELGAHIDGFPALVATTMVAGATPARPATGPAATLMKAAHLAGEVTLRLLRAGRTSSDVTRAIQQLLGDLDVRFVEGMISHSVTKDRLADDKMIVVRPAEGQARLVPESTFANYDVFVIDISLSNGSGGIRASEVRPSTVYKRTEETYALRLKTSRAVLGEIAARHGQMAFSLRQLGDGLGSGLARAKMALHEASQHRVVSAYEVLEETDKGALTARCQFTVILLPTGPLRITDPRWIPELVQSAAEVKTPEVRSLLAQPVRDTKSRKK